MVDEVIRKIQDLIDDVRQHQNALNKSIDALEIAASGVFDIDAPGTDRSLTSRERLLMCAINSKRGLFSCDILSASDIYDAMLALYPDKANDYSAVTIGRMLTNIGRYVKVRANDGGSSVRLWIIRNFTEYNHLYGMKIYEVYDRTKRNLPLLGDEPSFI